MSVQEFIEDLAEGNLEHAGERLEDFAKSCLLDLANGIEQMGGETAWSIVKKAVETEDPQDKTNDEKHASASDAIAQAVLQAGQPVIKWVIDSMIKMVVAQIRKLAS